MRGLQKFYFLLPILKQNVGKLMTVGCYLETMPIIMRHRVFRNCYEFSTTTSFAGCIVDGMQLNWNTVKAFKVSIAESEQILHVF